MSKFVSSENSARGLMQFYDVVLAPMGVSFPNHLKPVAYALMDPRITKLMVVMPPGLGKSLLLSVVYPAHCLGLDPAQNILSISAGEDLVRGFMQATGRIIESPTYQTIFPHTRPGSQWGASGLSVTNHSSSPDASYFSCGIDSSALTGKHATRIILDDIHNAVNSTTTDQCEKVVARYYNTVIGRADPRGCRFVIVGRRWHQSDIYGELAKGGQYVVLTLPAERLGTDKLWYDVEIPDGLQCCFNED